MRYIGEAFARKILFNKKRVEISADLKAKGFKSLPSIEEAANHVGWEETEEEEEVAAGGYDYLLAVAFAGVKRKELMKLEEERDVKKKEFDELTNTLSKSLWLRDLDALDHQLDVCVVFFFKLRFFFMGFLINVLYFVCCVIRNKIK